MMDIKNVKNAQKEEFDWIPVEEKLPTENEMVLITFISVLDNKTLCVETACYDGEYWCGEDLYRIKAKVLAWKPLPKPYIPATPTIFLDEKNDFEKRINLLDRTGRFTEKDFYLKEIYQNLTSEQRDVMADKFVKILTATDTDDILEKQDKDYSFFVLSFLQHPNLCILGKDCPSCHEAKEFLKMHDMYKMYHNATVTNICEVDREYLDTNGFVLDNIENWPVFSQNSVISSRHYYVLSFSDGTDHCIIGTEHPTCEEAAEFLKSNEYYEDLMIGRRIKYVREISEEEAFDEFIMEEIEEWPVFHPYPDAKFTSVYDNGSVILTVDCKVNPKTREIFEVSENPIADEHSMTIVREYVTIDGKEYPAVDSMGYPDAVDNPEVYWY